MANINPRKKLDDYHTKVLRELGALPCNKNCFDCNQRGPTYVNVTIGSFVCSKCSGILRGLTPPHRVKSISMTTFTPDEVEMLKSKGNDYCRKVWLGLCDNSIIPCKDGQPTKDFLIDKYEKKRYYIDPSTIPNLKPPTLSLSTQNPVSSQHTVTKSIPLRTTQITLTNGSLPSTSISTSSTSSTNNKTNGLFHVDFNNAPKDPFSNSTPSPLSIQRNSSSANSHQLSNNSPISQSQQPSFANFDNAVFSSVQSVAGQAEPSRKQMSSPLEIQKEDKYAALKDLDSIMKQQHLGTSPSSAHPDHQNLNHDASKSNGWNGGVFGSPIATNSLFPSASSNGFSNGYAFGSGSPNMNGSAFSSPNPNGNIFGNSHNPNGSFNSSNGLNSTNGSSGVFSNSNGSVFGSPSTNGSLFGSPNGRSTDSPLTNGSDTGNPFGNANPFRTSDAWPSQNVSNGVGNGVTNGFPMSQSLDFSAVKGQSQWPMVNHQIANPFKMNTAAPQTTAPHHSSNPFL